MGQDFHQELLDARKELCNDTRNEHKVKVKVRVRCCSARLVVGWMMMMMVRRMRMWRRRGVTANEIACM